MDCALAQSEKDRNAVIAAENELWQLTTDLKTRNEELERYAYTISHDLKSPLYTILGFTGFLEKDLVQGKTEKLPEELATIRDAARTMSKLLDDILNISKINLADELAQRVSLEEIVNEAINLLSREIRERGISLVIEPDMPEIFAVPHRMVEVYQNLIGNAAKFIGAGKNPEIRIGASQSGGWVNCYISDNGIGMEPKYTDRVFNLFERLDNSIEGTGIGLAIVKRIIDRHGGSISLKSEGRGAGCRVEFTLPTGPAG